MAEWGAESVLSSGPWILERQSEDKAVAKDQLALSHSPANQMVNGGGQGPSAYRH